MLPVVFVWQQVDVVDGDGDGVVTRTKAMVPLARYGNVAGRQFQDGEEYPLVVLEARSRASHNQFFASVGDAFDNMPEDLGKLAESTGLKTIPPGGWVNAEHLRKWALCETGWCEVAEFAFDTSKEAMRLARFYRGHDLYAQITVRGTHVIIKTAKSQSAAAMAKRPFEESKRSVLDLLDSMIGVKRGSLKKHGGKAA